MIDGLCVGLDGSMIELLYSLISMLIEIIRVFVNIIGVGNLSRMCRDWGSWCTGGMGRALFLPR